MNDLPKISIVTPNFNGAAYLEETILSVLGQNYPNLEYIIVDGGSTDGSVEIIKKYQEQLHWWISESDTGLYDAIQKGFEKSTGELMAWINSDDMYHKNAFFTIAEIFSSFKQVNWLVGTVTSYDELGRTIFCGPSRSFSKFDFYNGDFKWLQQESVFWRRELWIETGACLNTNLKYAADFALWIKFFKNDKLFVTDALIGGFRYRSVNQISFEHLDDYLLEADKIIKSVTLTSAEKKALLNYKRLLKIIKVIKYLKFIRTDWMTERYRSKYFLVPPRIRFDRPSKRFILSN